MRTKRPFLRVLLISLVSLIAMPRLPAGVAQDCNPAQGDYTGRRTVRLTEDQQISQGTFNYTLHSVHASNSTQVRVRVECDGSVTGSASGTWSINGSGTGVDQRTGQTFTVTRKGSGSYREAITGKTYNQPDGSVFLVVLELKDQSPAQTYREETIANGSSTVVDIPVSSPSAEGPTAELKPEGPNPPAIDALRNRTNGTSSFPTGSATISKSWDLSGKSPVLLTLEPQYEQIFLGGVSVKNKYTATADWKGVKEPRRITFKLNGTERDGTLSGDTAYVEYDMGNDFLIGQANTLEVTARSGDGDSGPITLSPEVVAVPAWAGSPSSFTATPSGSTINYQTTLRWPDPAINVTAVVPDRMPYVGGRWGLTDGQIAWDINASSSGSLVNGSINGNPKLTLKSTDYVFAISGDSRERITTGSGIDLDKGDVTLQSPMLTASHTTGLIDLIPAAVLEGISQIPLVGAAVADFITSTLNSLGSVTASVGVGIDATGKFDDNGSRLEWKQGAGTLKADVNLTAILLACVDLSGGGNGTLSVQWHPSAQVNGGTITLYFEITIRSSLWDYGPERKDHTWVFGSPVVLASELPGNFSARLEERPPLPPNYARFVGGTTGGTRALGFMQSNERVLVQQGYRRANPRMAVAPDGRAAMAWVHDDPAKPTQQSKEISVSLFDGSSWATPSALTSDTNADLAPSVAIDAKGNVMVLWERHTTADLPSTVQPDTSHFAGYDIWYARYDAATKAWSAAAALTANAYLDHYPRVVAAQDGSLLAVWVANQGNRLVGAAAAPDTFLSSAWSGTAWSTPVTVTTVSAMFGWDVAAGATNAAATLFLSQDVDGKLDDATDREVFWSSWNGTTWSPLTRATTNAVSDDLPQVIYDSGNLPQFFWRQKGALVTASGTPTGTVRTLAAALPTEPALAAGAEKRLAAVWPTSALTATNLVAATYTNGAGWSGPQPLTDDLNVEHSVSAAYLPTNELLVGYARTPVTRGTVEITTTGQTITDVATLGSFSDLVVGRYKEAKNAYLPLVLSAYPVSAAASSSVLPGRMPAPTRLPPTTLPNRAPVTRDTTWQRRPTIVPPPTPTPRR